MLKEIFTRQRRFLNYFFDHINMEDAEKILHVFLGCKGMVIFTGVGKSGIIAEKLSKTMISTGTKAIFLPPSNALHGDIGIVSEDDLVVMISKSGKGSEVLGLAKALRRRNITLMSWVSATHSPLAGVSDYVMHLPHEGEICPFDLVPTTSTAVQLIFGDVIAVGLMQAKKFSLDQFALNHPAGSIGRLISERVEDVMIQGEKLPTCTSEMFIKDILFELSSKGCGCILILGENQALEGIFTDGDLRRTLEKYQNEALSVKIKDVMSRDYLYVEPKTLTSSALKLMNGEKKVTALPVIDEKKLVGLFRIQHIFDASLSDETLMNNSMV